MRITDQYLWNIIFTIFFLGLVYLAVVTLEEGAYRPYHWLTLADYVLITLASLRLTRLVVYDKITAFFRDQFYNLSEQGTLMKPEKGPRRTLADLLGCVWCFGMWATATVAFFYLLTPYAFFPVLILALSGAVSSLQIFVNLIGWKAEQAKIDVERM